MEIDPFHNNHLSQNRIILGSFPTWSLTTTDTEKEESEKEKQIIRAKNGDLPYYYGSASNKFWSWYSIFFDNSVQPNDLLAIQKSLKSNKIGITNIIISAKRKDRSSFDYDLSKRVYNYRFFDYPKEGNILKVLCTSKTVLNEMLLSHKFFSTHTRLSICENATNLLKETLFSSEFIDLERLNQPLCHSINVEEGGKIECVSIPSPGSPFRGLNHFGKLKEMQSKEFIRKYLTNVFSWFKN